ncbi:MAG: hypothetical protein L0338_38345 [Acidobacteria bacterium]|nr:hypothetical protein [Acidobacteriota bacterium]
MNHSPQFNPSLLDDASLLQLAKTALMDAYPNSERIGCPSRELRAALAAEKLDLRNHWDVLDHIGFCSPCFVEQLALRRSLLRRNFVRRAICVSVLLLCAVGYFGYRALYPSPAPQQFAATFNLQDRPVFRGQRQAATQFSPFVLPRGIVHLTITLPLGSEPGAYELRLLPDGQSNPVFTATAQAILQAGGSTVLTVDLDSTKLRAGQYALGIRKGDAPWSYSPLVVR